LIARLLAAVARALAAPTVFWTSGVPDGTPRIYFANHTSHLDFAILWAALPRRVRAAARPVGARDYWEGGPIRRFLARRVFHAILIDRSTATDGDRAAAARASIERIASTMRPGESLIVFPEGTRGRGPDPGPFRSGLYHLCRLRPDLEVLPVYLGNLARILPKGSTVPLPDQSRVVFGAPMRLRENEDKTAFLQRARAAICELRTRPRQRRGETDAAFRVRQRAGTARIIASAFRRLRPVCPRR
jgi:1-acyl-sn-glycerol-3-phosphate acyltransferase